MQTVSTLLNCTFCNASLMRGSWIEHPQDYAFNPLNNTVAVYIFHLHWSLFSHSLADHVSRHMKAIQLVLFVAATVSLALFALMCAEIIPYCKAVLFLTFILGGFVTSGTIPLFFEMAVETAYPDAEGITSCFLIMSCKIPLLLFYIFPLLPNFGLKWINWCAFGTYAACIPLLALWRERYYRSEVDDQGKPDQAISNSIS